jgi:palmitoyltransferase ZDHHC9/14/18
MLTVTVSPSHSIKLAVINIYRQGSNLFYFILLGIQVLVNLFLVSTIDPGIIPRNDGSSIEETAGTSDGTRRKRVTVNGVELKLKYCRICKFFRPPRSCHCAICDNCVEKFDHHCPWIGQCIALVLTLLNL